MYRFAYLQDLREKIDNLAEQVKKYKKQLKLYAKKLKDMGGRSRPAITQMAHNHPGVAHTPIAGMYSDKITPLQS